jgi:hypothetical protein
LVLALWTNRPNSISPTFAVIERSYDSSGLATSDYIAIYILGTVFLHQIALNGAGWNASINAMITLLANATSLSLGSYLGVSPAFPYNGRAENPGQLIGAMKAADATQEGTLSISLYGATRTFMMLVSAQSAFLQVVNGNAAAILIGWQ